MSDDDVITPRFGGRGRDVAGIAGRLARGVVKRRWFWIVMPLALLGWCGPRACTSYVPPATIGVKQVYYGGNAGIRKELYGPGLHFVALGIERLHHFPSDVQVVNFSDSASETSREFRTAPAVKIQTSDGYQVILDISLIYHLDDPHKVITEAGPGRAFEDRLVIPRADRILRKTLGELNAEEFYQGPRRITQSKEAEQELRAELAGYGIGVDHVLVRRYQYDQRYQQLIEGRKIKDQTVFLRQAEAKAAIEQRKRDTMIAEGRAKAEIELERGKAEVAKLKSQADLYRRQRGADGRLLVELAEAKGTQLENTALQGQGAENIVGLKMADVLRGVRVLVLSSDGAGGTNPLDLAGTLRKFEVR